MKLRIFAQQQLTLLPALPLLAYLLGVLYNYSDRQIFDLFWTWVPRVLLALVIAFPYGILHAMVDRALQRPERDAPSDRLRRILSLPRRIELVAVGFYLLTMLLITLIPSLIGGQSLWLLVPILLLTLVVISLLLVRQTLKVEELLRPLAVEEFERHPGTRPAGAWFVWPRQVWYLPYVTSLVLLASFSTLGVIVIRRFQAFMDAALGDLRRQGYAALAAQVGEWGQQLLHSLAKGYGEDLRRLSQIVGDNASAARQISAAVSQQSAGIAQIFEAITSLGRAMGETVDTLKATEAVTSRAQHAAEQVAGAMAGYRFRA